MPWKDEWPQNKNEIISVFNKAKESISSKNSSECLYIKSVANDKDDSQLRMIASNASLENAERITSYPAPSLAELGTVNPVDPRYKDMLKVQELLTKQKNARVYTITFIAPVELDGDDASGYSYGIIATESNCLAVGIGLIFTQKAPK
jgi:hypothetical protein